MTDTHISPVFFGHLLSLWKNVYNLWQNIRVAWNQLNAGTLTTNDYIY